MRKVGMTLLALTAITGGINATGCATAQQAGAAATGAFTITSPAFENNGTIPLRHSPYGDDNLSPALSWTGAPAGTQSFALILDDPDAGANPFVHWVIYNIPGSATGLPEGIAADADVANPAGAQQGVTGLRRTGYFGPRPPAGAAHHYHFKLYALSTPPNLAAGLTKETLLAAMEGNILAETELVGVYQAQ
jgi:Raf kinase inhibitor-like YbhB/YbcL family protein